MKRPREGSNIGESLLNPNNPYFFLRAIKKHMRVIKNTSLSTSPKQCTKFERNRRGSSGFKIYEQPKIATAAE